MVNSGPNSPGGAAAARARQDTGSNLLQELEALSQALYKASQAQNVVSGAPTGPSPRKDALRPPQHHHHNHQHHQQQQQQQQQHQQPPLSPLGMQQRRESLPARVPDNEVFGKNPPFGGGRNSQAQFSRKGHQVRHSVSARPSAPLYETEKKEELFKVTRPNRHTMTGVSGPRAPPAHEHQPEAEAPVDPQAERKLQTWHSQGFEKTLPDAPNNFPEWLEDNMNFSKTLEAAPEKKKSIWNWKPFRTLSHIGHTRYNCLFTLHVHAIEGLPQATNGLRLTVHWRHKERAVQTMPCRVFQGSAEFEESLQLRCSVYGSKSAHQAVKFMPKAFTLGVIAQDVDELILGQHRLDLSRLLPEPQGNEYDDDGKPHSWTTSFKLSGKAKGGTLVVTFGYEILQKEKGDKSGRSGSGMGSPFMNSPSLRSFSGGGSRSTHGTPRPRPSDGSEFYSPTLSEPGDFQESMTMEHLNLDEPSYPDGSSSSSSSSTSRSSRGSRGGQQQQQQQQARTTHQQLYKRREQPAPGYPTGDSRLKGPSAYPQPPDPALVPPAPPRQVEEPAEPTREAARDGSPSDSDEEDREFVVVDQGVEVGTLPENIHYPEHRYETGSGNFKDLGRDKEVDDVADLLGRFSLDGTKNAPEVKNADKREAVLPELPSVGADTGGTVARTVEGPGQKPLPPSPPQPQQQQEAEEETFEDAVEEIKPWDPLGRFQQIREEPAVEEKAVAAAPVGQGDRHQEEEGEEERFEDAEIPEPLRKVEETDDKTVNVEETDDKAVNVEETDDKAVNVEETDDKAVSVEGQQRRELSPPDSPKTLHQEDGQPRELLADPPETLVQEQQQIFSDPPKTLVQKQQQILSGPSETHHEQEEQREPQQQHQEEKGEEPIKEEAVHEVEEPIKEEAVHEVEEPIKEEAIHEVEEPIKEEVVQEVEAIKEEVVHETVISETRSSLPPPPSPSGEPIAEEAVQEEREEEEMWSRTLSLSAGQQQQSPPPPPPPPVDGGHEKDAFGASTVDDLDDEVDLIAGDFLSMLDGGGEKGGGQIMGMSSDSEADSPRALLLRQFEQEALLEGGAGLRLGTPELPDLSLDGMPEEGGADRNVDEPGPTDPSSDSSAPGWQSGEHEELASIMEAAESELQKATQTMRSKTRAKMLEDAETEALMQEWGLNENAFQHSPPKPGAGFLEMMADQMVRVPTEAPALAQGVGPFVQTKDGGMLRSMTPALFPQGNSAGKLVMQVSKPVVVPSEMGSSGLDIFRQLASGGVENMALQAMVAMPLEDITGKSVHQLAYESQASLEGPGQQYLPSNGSNSHLSIADTGRRSRSGLALSRSRGVSGGVADPSDEFVGLEELAPMAMQKVEALAVNGLKIQADMTDESAPYSVDALPWANGAAQNSSKFKRGGGVGSLDGVAAMHLLDARSFGDDIPTEAEGLMSKVISIDEWMRLDAGQYDDTNTKDETLAILAAHGAVHKDVVARGSKEDRIRYLQGAKASANFGKGGFMGNTLTIAMLVQLRDPLRNNEPVGAPMMALVQAERVIVPPRPKLPRRTPSLLGNGVKWDEEETEAPGQDEAPEPQFKVTAVHVSGLKSAEEPSKEQQPDKKKSWGNQKQQQSGSRWLAANGMGKSTSAAGSKLPALRGKPQPEKKQGESLWSISSRIGGAVSRWKDKGVSTPHIRNPDVNFSNQKVRAR